MLKRKFTLMCFVAVIASTSSFALAKAFKADLMSTGVESGASGKAIANFAKGNEVTQFQVNCRGLTPGAEYGVFFPTKFGGERVGIFTVQEDGTGKLHVALKGDYSGRPVAVGHVMGYLMVLKSE
jgi:hypothetical protein